MAPETPEELPAPPALRVLAGLEVGVFGGILMIAWFVLDAWLRHEFVWKVPNLIASSVYGQSVFRRAFGMPAVTGMAIHTIAAGSVGMLFGLAMVRLPGAARRTLFAFGASFGWYWIARAWLWEAISPLLPYYTNPATLFMGHVLFAVSLSRFSSRLERLQLHVSPGARRAAVPALLPPPAGELSAVEPPVPVAEAPLRPVDGPPPSEPAPSLPAEPAGQSGPINAPPAA